MADTGGVNAPNLIRLFIHKTSFCPISLVVMTNHFVPRIVECT